MKCSNFMSYEIHLNSGPNCSFKILPSFYINIHYDCKIRLDRDVLLNPVIPGILLKTNRIKRK